MAEESAQLKRPGSIARLIAPALLLIAMLSGCVPPDLGKKPPAPRTPIPASQPAPAPAPVPPPAPEPEPAASPAPAPPPMPVRVIPPVSPASQTLLDESRSHAAAGRYPQAAASIERAIRIEPRQPVLWLELGNIRLKEGNLAQAESLGRKALSLSAGDAGLSARAQQLITAAKKR